MSQHKSYKRTAKLPAISCNDYLKRINIQKTGPSLKLLQTLHKSHLMHIPYENLDVYFGRKLLFDVDKIFEKIIFQKRGGIAFELNILFYHLLLSLDFECTLISAKIRHGKSWSPDLDHPLIMVQINNEKWLADVGSFSNFLVPIKMVPDITQLDYNQYFRFIKDPDEHFILQKSSDSIVFHSLFQIDEAPRGMIEFLERFNYYQDSDNSPLRACKYVSKYTKGGKITLTDTELIILDLGNLEKTSILQEDDFASKLLEYFEIDYDLLFRQRLS